MERAGVETKPWIRESDNKWASAGEGGGAKGHQGLQGLGNVEGETPKESLLDYLWVSPLNGHQDTRARGEVVGAGGVK